MASEQTLIREMVRSKMQRAQEIIGSFEKEDADRSLIAEWRGQAIMAQTILNVLESA